MGKRNEILDNIWPEEKDRLENELSDPGKYTTAIYNVQLFTNLLFDYAYQRRDVVKLDQLAELYMIPLNFLEEFSDYWFYKGGADSYTQLSLPSPSKMWAKETKKKIGVIPLESILDSSQFLYLISHAIHTFVSLPESDRSSNMKALINQYTPVVLDHYNRWIFASNGSTDLSDSIGVFQRKDWGCNRQRFNHKEFLEKKLNREFGKPAEGPTPFSRCNALLDSDMWIFAGAVEILAAQEKKPGLFSITAEEKENYREYFSIASRLLEDRLERTTLEDFNGSQTSGYNFDPGPRKEYHDMRYAGYTGSVFPEDNSVDKDNPVVIIRPEDFPLPDSLSFDTGHARRFVQVFETLYRNRSVTRQVFPSKEVLKGLANQVTYRLFNRDFRKPLFRNYFDGTNGWYRVNYSKRDRFGFAPWDVSFDWISCGFGAWQKYQPHLTKVCQAVWDMINSTDPGTAAFRLQHYEKSHHSGDGRAFRKDCFSFENSPFILNFIAAYDLPIPPEKLPKLSINRTRLNFGALVGSEKVYSQQVTVTNTGAGTLAWTAVSDAGWLSCSPAQGIDSGVLTVSVDARNLPAGTHEGAVVVGDPDAENAPQTITVALKVYQSPGDIKLRGDFDAPKDRETVSGSVPVSGWALDDVEVESVKIYREPLPGEGEGLFYIDDALFVEGERNDIVEKFPDIPMNYRAGWGYILLTNALPDRGNGEFKLIVKARNTSGREKTLGEKTIRCDNANAVQPFGAIDTPKPGAVASGSHFRIQGWVLTPLPNKIPEDGSTIRVLVDGEDIGPAKYNIHRPDIAKFFPGFANSRGALARFDLDTTKFSNKVCTVAFVVTDNAGNSAGIGSRFFIIRN